MRRDIHLHCRCAEARARQWQARKEENRYRIEIEHELSRYLQVFEQVGHLLQVDLFLEIARHGGEIRYVHVPDVLALNDVLLAVFMAQRDGGGTLALRA